MRGERYRRPGDEALAEVIENDLHCYDFDEARRFYAAVLPVLSTENMALLGCNDRFFLLTVLLGRRDACHPWLYTRCREVEAEPDGYLDLWSRDHYKSTIISYAGIIQEVMCNPELTVGIFSFNQRSARAFLKQIANEFERNELLRSTYPDVIWDVPKVQAPQWAMDKGIVLKRATNPKEATVEASGLVDGMPTGKHYELMVYDDVVIQASVTNPEMVKKTTESWELSSNLGSRGGRRWHIGTRYSFNDTYATMLSRGSVKPRIYPATDNGRIDGTPVFLTPEVWAKKVNDQRSTLAAQMLQNPLMGQENMFMPGWFNAWEIRPSQLSVYITADPSLGRSASSDRTAMVVVGIDAAGNKYLLDGYCHRMSLTERWACLKNLYKKWSTMRGVQMCAAGYERYGQQADSEYFREQMSIEGFSFPLRELNWTRDGTHSKADRVGRLEPDFRRGKFYLPAVIYRPGLGDCLWSIDDEAGKVIERKMEKKPASMTALEKLGQPERIARSLKRLDENKKVYDVTECLMEEMTFFPFARHDDLVDALSRIYDMDPVGPSIHEDSFVEHANHRMDFIDA